MNDATKIALARLEGQAEVVADRAITHDETRELARILRDTIHVLRSDSA